MTPPSQIYYPTVNAPKEEEISIISLLKKYIFNYWYLYLLCAGLCVGLAKYYLQFVNPVYVVKSRLLIKEDKDKAGSPEDMLKGLNLFGASENVLNEIHIISSVNLMEQVVAKLNLEVDYFWKEGYKITPTYHEFPVRLTSYELAPAILNSDAYRLRSGWKMECKYLGENRFELLHDEQSIGEYNFDVPFTTPFGKFEITKVHPIDISSEAMLFISIQDPSGVAEGYVKEMRVNLVEEEASIIELSMKEEVPQKAKEILGTLVEIYNQAAIEDKNKVSENTLNFVEERLGGISQELASVERKVERYKRKNSISSTSEKDIEIILMEVSKFTESQTGLEVQLDIIQAMESNFNHKGGFELIPANLSVSSAVLKDMISPYNQLVLKRQQLLETATSTNPLVKTTEQQLISMRNTIQHTIKNITQDIQNELSSIGSLNKGLMNKIKKIPTQERGLLEIKRQQLVKENLYIFLLKKKEETALTLAASTSNARVIDTPRISRKPVSPRKALVLLGSLLGGMFLPFLFVAGKDILKDSIENEEDIKAITDTPIIGNITKSKSNEPIVIKENSRTSTAEHFRLIRTNLQMTKKKGTQTVLVTSSISGEGKTFVAMNLAMSFAITRQKTILIGMDLRKPEMQKYINEPSNSKGVTDYILGNASIEEITQQHTLNPKLNYITCGTVPFNPNELLSEPIVADLFAQLQKEYDVIIIDTPPIGIVSDALLLTEFTTNTLYIVRAKVTKQQMLFKANELLKKRRLRNPCILLNGTNKTKSYGYYNN